jgi:hypothetical protein
LPTVRPVTVNGLAAPVFDPAKPPLLDVHVAVKLVIVTPATVMGAAVAPV